MRAVPHWYAGIEAEPGVEVTLRVTGKAGGGWTLRRESGAWRLYRGASDQAPAATVTISDDTAWKFLTRSISPERAESLVRFEGDRKLARGFLAVKAIMMED